MIGSGYAVKTGKNVTDIQAGDPVLLSFYACGACEQCRDKHPSYCDSFATENYIGRTGHVTCTGGEGEEVHARFFGQSSFARYSVVDRASVVNAKPLIKDESELSLFAPLGCGFQTGMGAIENVARPGLDDAVVVLGLGSVGVAALMVSPSPQVYKTVLMAHVWLV